MNNIKHLILIIALFFSNLSFAYDVEIDYVLVKKSAEKMYLYSNGLIVKIYTVSFGANPQGHKVQEGDERTPEGKYILDYKIEESSYYKSIHISYPNKKDIEAARKAGVNPGGQIMIHGQKNGFGWFSWVMQKFNWTDGCIAVTNQEMEEIWQLVDIGTPIEIRP